MKVIKILRKFWIGAVNISKFIKRCNFLFIDRWSYNIKTKTRFLLILLLLYLPTTNFWILNFAGCNGYHSSLLAIGWGAPPPLKPSFTAIVRGTHDHAREAFKDASTYKGEPALHYSEPEVLDLSSLLRFALIGKIFSDRPSMEFLRRGFKTIGFKRDVQLALMDQYHVLIHFDLEEDYHRCWLHSSWRFKDHIMKVLKWAFDFSVKEELSVVPVWVSLEQLPSLLFSRGPLFFIG